MIQSKPLGGRRRGAAHLAVLGITAVGLLTAAVFFSAPAAAQEKPAGKPPAETKAADAPLTYVGSETCQTCHEDIYKAFQKNPHQLVEKNKTRGFDGKACESCHGPASKHAESATATDIKNPAKLAPQATDKICLTCHLNQPTHTGRIQNAHAKNSVSCVSCHSIHKGPEAMVARKATAINKQCAGCHAGAMLAFQKPYTHKVAQGVMSCVDCHNPHGSFLPKQIQTAQANEPGCLKCHGDKRGPFAYEHAPVRLDGCGACHEAHGSANPRMLTRQEVRLTCLECHANLPSAKPVALGGVPPAFHDLRSPRYRNCTTCHVKIHGSHVNRAFTK